MTAKRMTALLACLLLLGSLQAAVSQAQLYQKMRAAYGSLKTYQAELSQSNYYPQLKRTISYNGKIYFTPGRMLMSFSSPSVQRLQIRDGQVELYDASSKTLLRAPMQPEFGKMNPVEILDLYWQKSRVSVTSETKSQASVSLRPKSDKLISSLCHPGQEERTGHFAELHRQKRQQGHLQVQRHQDQCRDSLLGVELQLSQRRAGDRTMKRRCL